ncbi:hypothetical protein ACIOEZ_24785 [Streptomyces sp. NPDC087866]|uniref:hypothetical protein n=1 Tax=unclassified Streptomyces TaxID=2593676 RepID=UPI00225246E3|nr:hypothetical protein [Streptomyces sp. NBC_01789]MCX4446029.1 hypothetical protein [Streptomyces sp. NBC_01789]
MDQHHSRHPQGSTPIYDRLLAEWQAARAAPAPEPSRAGGLVPAARTSDEVNGRG